jgi:hypothetical protein
MTTRRPKLPHLASRTWALFRAWSHVTMIPCPAFPTTFSQCVMQRRQRKFVVELAQSVTTALGGLVRPA